MDAALEEILQVLENVLVNLFIEMDIVEDLFDSDDDDDEGDANGVDNFELNNYRGEIAVRELIQLVEALIWDRAHLEDEEDFILADGRVVLDRHFRALSIQRFKNLDDPSFAQHFPMNRQVFEVLIQELGNHLVDQNRLHRLRTGLDVCLLMALWILGNLSSFRGTGVVFGTSRSVVHFHYLVGIEALREFAYIFIKWPGIDQRNHMKAVTERRSGYPGVVGMMDGTLITVTAPKIQRERYFVRCHNYSYNSLFVCDMYLRLIHVYVGEAGSAHDSLVFQRSPLYNILLERPNFLSDDEHVLADGAYTLTSKVMVPYRDNGRLTQRQRNFNYIHSRNRMPIEKTNGRVKEKWRRLYRFHVTKAEYAVDHIMACAVLHNFVLLEGREPDGIAVEAAEQQNMVNIEIGQEHPLLRAARIAGLQKRDAMALRLLPNDAL